MIRTPRRVLALISIFLSLSLLLSGCSRRQKSPEDILSELMGADSSLPRGEIYGSEAGEGEAGYPPSVLLRAMYGENCEELIRSCDFSIYLSSFAIPLEIAVFQAPSKDHAREIYALCLTRMDLLKVSLRQTDHADLCEEIRVYRSGRYVVMGVTWDGDSFFRAAKSEVG